MTPRRAAPSPHDSAATKPPIPRSDIDETQRRQQADSAFETQRGVALPGDRGPRTQASQTQRPSFWRRIALGGRKADSVEVAKPKPSLESFDAVENRIVEPLLQALVSVEAKLERSHVDLIQRSDQVEQRLTQLWDIEEQLGGIGELQESLLHVSEQQRRLATAVESQTRTLRWLVGAIFFSLAAAAFVVGAVLR
jgi:hypothetical protein